MIFTKKVYWDCFWSICNKCNRQNLGKKYNPICDMCKLKHIVYYISKRDGSVYKIDDNYNEDDVKNFQKMLEAFCR